MTWFRASGTPTGVDSEKNAITPSTILEGFMGWVNGKKIIGTMPNKGAWSANTTGSGNVTIPAGYHNGSGYVSGNGAYNKGKTDYNPTQATLTNAGVLSVKNANGVERLSKTFTNNYDAGVSADRNWISSLIKSAVARYNTGVNSWGNINSQTDANNYVDAAYNQGVNNADGRANADSTNYKTGYTNGHSVGYSEGQKSVFTFKHIVNSSSYAVPESGYYMAIATATVVNDPDDSGYPNLNITCDAPRGLIARQSSQTYKEYGSSGITGRSQSMVAFFSLGAGSRITATKQYGSLDCNIYKLG